MSGRGRGRGRGRGGDGGGRGQHQPRQDRPSPSYDRGGGGDARRQGRVQEQPQPQPQRQPQRQPQPQPQPASSSSTAPPAPANLPSSSQAVPSLSQGVEKLSVTSSSQPQERNLAQPPPASAKSLRFPPRPGYGTLGMKCVVRANHFLVQVADKDLHHYDVSISPEVLSKNVCRDIIQQLVEMYKESHLGKRVLAYDGSKNAYAAGALPFTSKEFVVNLAGKDDGSSRERQFKVSIKFAGKPDLHHLQQFLNGRQADVPQETIQVLDVVLRATPSMKYTVVGRSFFSPMLGDVGELGDGLQYWKGFYQSLRPTQMGLSLNIDISARAFFEPILVSEFVAKYFYGKDLSRRMSDQDRVKVKKALKGVRVEVNHGGQVKRYKISGISLEPTNQLMFALDESGKMISVAEYFRQRYNIVLKYPFLPALQAGSDKKPAQLPMEVCRIVGGQRYSKKLNDRQVTALLRATCQRPVERQGNILQMVKYNNYNQDKLVNNEFGIEVRAELASIEARVLRPPKLQYHQTGQEKQVDPRVGQWNMINKKMYNGAKVNFWTCINFSRMRQDGVQRFCDELIEMCCSKGMTFERRPVVPIKYSAHPSYVEKALLEVHDQSMANLGGKGRLQLLIIILPEITGSYGKIKRVCETELGIVSQCCQPKQAQKLQKQYLENVALKVNVKVGGRNTVLVDALTGRIPYVTDRPTIIFGADVTHPQPGEDSSPSIAAVVASMDWPEVTKYRGLVSAQVHREEIIQDLYKSTQDPQRGIVHSGMIRELLIAFFKSTGKKPDRIIFYRDGVSEGQFNQVLLFEMDAIRKACCSLEENYLPRVTFIVVQKRHHTRLFPADHRDNRTTDRSGNILPGTVVDTKICHPTDFDFYLCSHAGIQGTSRPTHYHVLYDENNFNADALQTLTNSLCYTFARCTRSVSIVPPAYYAHLAAFRARYYIEGETSDGGSTSGGGGRATRDRNVEVRPLPVIRDNVKEVMFYC